MSYEPRLPNFATMRQAMGRLSTGEDASYIPCPRPRCRGTLRVVDGEMSCDACAQADAPFPTTDRSQ